MVRPAIDDGSRPMSHIAIIGATGAAGQLTSLPPSSPLRPSLRLFGRAACRRNSCPFVATNSPLWRRPDRLLRL